VFISLYILWQSYLIVKEAVKVIMMASPEGISPEEIERTIEAIPGVQNVHHIHLWRLDENEIHFEAHVEIEDMWVSQTGALLNRIQQVLKEDFGISHVTIQFEKNQCTEKELVKQ